MSEKMVMRTFKHWGIEIKDGKTGEIVKAETVSVKPTKEKVAIAYIKETGNTNFILDIAETEELREMSVEAFLANSKVVEPKPVADTTPPTEEVPL